MMAYLQCAVKIHHGLAWVWERTVRINLHALMSSFKIDIDIVRECAVHFFNCELISCIQLLYSVSSVTSCGKFTHKTSTCILIRFAMAVHQFINSCINSAINFLNWMSMSNAYNWDEPIWGKFSATTKMAALYDVPRIRIRKWFSVSQAQVNVGSLFLFWWRAFNFATFDITLVFFHPLLLQ